MIEGKSGIYFVKQRCVTVNQKYQMPVNNVLVNYGTR